MSFSSSDEGRAQDEAADVRSHPSDPEEEPITYLNVWDVPFGESSVSCAVCNVLVLMDEFRRHTVGQSHQSNVAARVRADESTPIGLPLLTLPLKAAKALAPWAPPRTRNAFQTAGFGADSGEGEESASKGSVTLVLAGSTSGTPAAIAKNSHGKQAIVLRVCPGDATCLNLLRLAGIQWGVTLQVSLAYYDKVNKTLVAVSNDKDLGDRLADHPAGALYCLPQQPDSITKSAKPDKASGRTPKAVASSFFIAGGGEGSASPPMMLGHGRGGRGGFKRGLHDESDTDSEGRGFDMVAELLRRHRAGPYDKNGSNFTEDEKDAWVTEVAALGKKDEKAVLKAAKPMPEVVDAMRKERLKTGAGTSSAPRLGASPRTPSASAGSLLASSRSSLSKALSSDDTTSAIASTYRGEYKDAQGRKWLGLSPGDAIQFITSKIKGQGLNRVVKAENVTTRRKGLVVLADLESDSDDEGSTPPVPHAYTSSCQ